MLARQDLAPEPRYQLVPRTLCFVFHGDELLLVRGAPSKRLWAGLYNCIGGHVERGEDVAAAATREVREETGLEVRDLRLRGVVIIDAEPLLGIGLYVFSAQAGTRRVTPSAEGSLTWFARDSLPSQGLVEDLPVLLDRILSAGPTDPPFSAHYSCDADHQLAIRFAPCSGPPHGSS